MRFGRNLGKSLSFSSSENSEDFNRTPNINLVLQDPRLNIEMPIYFVIKNYPSIKGNNSVEWESSLISLRRGLLLLKTISFLNDPRKLEWLGVLKIIRDSVSVLKHNTRDDVTSAARWVNIVQYLTRSRRFLTWVKIMKSLNVLKNEFPEIEIQAKSVFMSIRELLQGNSRIAIRNNQKWDEDLRIIPKHSD